jgi:hypothetical protein
MYFKKSSSWKEVAGTIPRAKKNLPLQKTPDSTLLDQKD